MDIVCIIQIALRSQFLDVMYATKLTSSEQIFYAKLGRSYGNKLKLYRYTYVYVLRCVHLIFEAASSSERKE